MCATLRQGVLALPPMVCAPDILIVVSEQGLCMSGYVTDTRAYLKCCPAGTFIAQAKSRPIQMLISVHCPAPMPLCYAWLNVLNVWSEVKYIGFNDSLYLINHCQTDGKVPEISRA